MLVLGFFFFMYKNYLGMFNLSFFSPVMCNKLPLTFFETFCVQVELVSVAIARVPFLH